MMATVISGYDTSAIHTAAASAGPGGTIFGPRGEYEVDGLTASYPDQTWVFDRGAVLKRSASSLSTSILEVVASNLRLRGGIFDGNWQDGSGNEVNSLVASGIRSTGHSLDLDGVEVRNVKHWGLTMTDAFLEARRSTFRNTGQAGIFWRITATGVARRGPTIDEVLIARALPQFFLGSGGVHVQSQHATARVVSGRISNTLVNLVQGPNYSAVAVEVKWADRFRIINNDVTGGRIGLSIGEANNTLISGNTARQAWDYHIEVAGNSQHTIVDHNQMFGYGPAGGGIGAGIENSNSPYTKIGKTNGIFNVKVPIRLHNSPGVDQAA